MAIGRVIAQIPNADIEQSLLDPTRNDPLREQRLEHLREDSDEINSHDERTISAALARVPVGEAGVRTVAHRFQRWVSRRRVYREPVLTGERKLSVARQGGL